MDNTEKTLLAIIAGLFIFLAGKIWQYSRKKKRDRIWLEEYNRNFERAMREVSTKEIPTIEELSEGSLTNDWGE